MSPTRGALRTDSDTKLKTTIMTLESTNATAITEVDLSWWREKIQRLDWVFAVTYAEGAPHEYIADRTEGMNLDDFVRAARVIHRFGEPQKFYKWTRIYLIHDGWKYWTMNDDHRAVALINRGRVEHVYGVQNAPRTKSATTSAYDRIASCWDSAIGATADERSAIGRFTDEITSRYRKYRTLDIGAGTGLALDLRLTEPVRCTAIDPSQAMLNELVRKHPLIARVEPMTFAEVRKSRSLAGTKFDLVLALGGAASYLSDEDLSALPENSRGHYVLSTYAPGESPITGDLSEVELATARERVRQFALEHGGRIDHVGRFEFALIDDRGLSQTG